MARLATRQVVAAPLGSRDPRREARLEMTHRATRPSPSRAASSACTRWRGARAGAESDGSSGRRRARARHDRAPTGASRRFVSGFAWSDRALPPMRTSKAPPPPAPCKIRRAGRSSSHRPARCTASPPTSRSARTRTSSSAPTMKGRWSYACSKAIDEFLALAYWKSASLERQARHVPALGAEHVEAGLADARILGLLASKRAPGPVLPTRNRSRQDRRPRCERDAAANRGRAPRRPFARKQSDAECRRQRARRGGRPSVSSSYQSVEGS